MKIKTSELTGPALDWAVAKCEGFEAETGAFWHLTHRSGERSAYAYSTDWSQGGPIIEREAISLIRCDDDYGRDENGFCNSVRIPVWAATTGQHGMQRCYEDDEDSLSQYESDLTYGPTPLVAAMRCYCCSKLGDEVDVPEELA